MTVERIITEIILNTTFLFRYVASSGFFSILLSTSEIFSITSKNLLRLITDMQTRVTMLLVYDEIRCIIWPVIKVSECKSKLHATSISIGNATVYTNNHITVDI
jgi:hypothetical protein